MTSISPAPQTQMSDEAQHQAVTLTRLLAETLVGKATMEQYRKSLTAFLQRDCENDLPGCVLQLVEALTQQARFTCSDAATVMEMDTLGLRHLYREAVSDANEMTYSDKAPLYQAVEKALQLVATAEALAEVPGARTPYEQLLADAKSMDMALFLETLTDFSVFTGDCLAGCSNATGVEYWRALESAL